MKITRRQSRSAARLTAIAVLVSVVPVSAQQARPSEVERRDATGSDVRESETRAIQSSSSRFVGEDGLTVESLIATGLARRADLLAARERLNAAEGRIRQAGLRPNPTLETEYGTPRFLGGERESEFSVGVSQTFETGNRRARRVAVARLELAQARAEVRALERRLSSEVRLAYGRAVAAARRLDALERAISTGEEIARVTGARLREGDVAPLDLNLVQLETERLRVEIIRTRGEIESEMIELRTLAGLDQNEPLRIAPFPLRPPRLDLTLVDATDIALRERSDLQAARLGEELDVARLRLAEAERLPNVNASVRYSRNTGIFDLPESLGAGLVATDRGNELTFGVAIELPVFNRNQGGIAAAASERAQAAREREFLETVIRRDTAIAFRRYRAAAETLVLYATRIMPRAEESLRIIRAAYALGEFSVFEVMSEQRRLIESETGLNDALRDYYAALAALESALGVSVPPSSFAPGGASVLPE